MRRSTENPAKRYRFWFARILILAGISTFIFGGPAGVWGEPPDIPNSNTWVTNGPVNAIVSEGGITYIGGGFTYVGPNTGSGASISEATGCPSPPYLPVNAPIYAVAPDGSGGWYIGGDFTRVGSVERSFIAHILPDDILDISWNPNANGRVESLAVSSGTVYAGGQFTSIGGQARNHVAALDAATGAATSWNPNANDIVWALAVSAGTVYAGGMYTSIGGQTRNGLAALDGVTGEATSWNPQATGVLALAVIGGTVYAGGYFLGSFGGQPRNYIAAFDVVTGEVTSWNPNANGWVRTLAVSGNTIYAGGHFLRIGGQERNFIAAIDAVTGEATSWNPNSAGAVLTLAVSGETVYAGGYFTSIGGQPRNYIAALDAMTGEATSWDPNADDLVNALAVSDGTVYAGGFFASIGGMNRNSIAALDASTGIPTSWNPGVNGAVNALTVSGGTVYVGGYFWSIGEQARNNIAALDATTGEPTSWNPDLNDEVYTLAVSGGTVYAGGLFTSIGGKTRMGIAAIDTVTGEATSWNANAAGPGYAYPYVMSLAVSGGTVYAGGYFTSIGGKARNRIAALNAATGAVTSWNPNATSGSNAAVLSLAVSGGTVYVGGDFTSIGGQPRNYIAAIDAVTGEATSWNPNADSTVRALAVSGGTVYAGGFFTSIGGQPRNYMAALDAMTGEATSWNPNAGGLDLPNPTVLVLAVNGGTVYAGGWFKSVGGESLPYFVQFGFNRITISPTRLEFGTLLLGSISLPQTLTITNALQSDLVINSILLTGPNTEQFILQGDLCSGKTLGISGSCTVEVSFAPTLTGLKSAYVTVASNTPEGGWTFDMPLTGSGGKRVTLFSPDGEEVMASGSTCLISWWAPSEAVKFKLQYSTDNGATWKKIASNLSGTTHNWTVPAPQNNKKACLVKVTGYDVSGMKVGMDRSDAPFTIEVVQLTSPSDPEISMRSEDAYNITWTANSTKTPVAKVELYYTTNATAVPMSWKSIAAFNPDDYPGLYPWPVPELPTMKTKCKVKVVLKDAKGVIVGSDVSDSYFAIQPPP
jgi:hypothetical protein